MIMKKLGFLLILAIFSCSTKENTLTIATAANMQFAMNALVEAYESETGTECEIILGSSGKLTAQIQEGAPYDLFFSADMKFPEALMASGNANSEPIIYAQGQLVLWTSRKSPLHSVIEIIRKETNHIALANPKTAPYGEATIQVLRNLDFYEMVNSKLVFGESISQVNQFVLSGAAEYGFTAKSVVLSPNMLEYNNWIDIADSLHTPINQSMIVIENNRELESQAERFVEFVLSQKGQVILQQYGYKQPPSIPIPE